MRKDARTVGNKNTRAPHHCATLYFSKVLGLVFQNPSGQQMSSSVFLSFWEGQTHFITRATATLPSPTPSQVRDYLGYVPELDEVPEPEPPPLPVDEEVEQPETEPLADLSPLAWGLAHLHLPRHYCVTGNVGMSRGSGKRRLEAAAEALKRVQQLLLKDVLAWVQFHTDIADIHPIAFIEHTQYDETQLEIRLHHDTGDTSKASPVANKEVAKTFICEYQWGMLVRKAGSAAEAKHALLMKAPSTMHSCILEGSQQYLFIRGCASPTLSAASDVTGETVASVAKNAFAVPWESLQATFPRLIRLCETDHASSNCRGEAILKADRPGAWSELHIYCMAHRAHSIAQKTWALQLGCVSGLAHASKFLGLGGQHAQAQASYGEIVGGELRCGAYLTRPPRHSPFARSGLAALCSKCP